MGMTFLGDCVGWPHHDVHAPGGLTDMIDAARHVSRKTFLKRVDVAASALIRVFGEHGNTRYDKYPPNSRAYPLFSVLNRYAIKYGLVEE